MSSSSRQPKKPSRARGRAPRAKAAAKPASRASKPASRASRPAPKASKLPAKASKSSAAARKQPPRTQPRPVPKSAPRPLPQRAARPVKPDNGREQRTAPPSRPSIRLAGSASSRLTIKPSPPQGPRPQLELSTRPRPSGTRPLSEVDLEEDEVLIDGFDATLEGERVRITAVLERTCVYVDSVGDRRLARKENLLVEADKLPIRRRGLG